MAKPADINSTAGERADHRRDQLAHWGRSVLQGKGHKAAASASVVPLSGDASFRRYFRLIMPESNFLLVDAPPPQEDCHPFVHIARLLQSGGLASPEIVAVDYDRGMMLLEDFGDTLYLSCLRSARASGEHGRIEQLYQQATDALLQMQQLPAADLPQYNRALLHTELSLFDEWFCEKYLSLELSAGERTLLAETWHLIENAALSQPQVFVHRDYHSRNLMVRESNEMLPPGIIDFQDAVCGPYTYDLVSLLRDCYIEWPPADVQRWVASVGEQLQAGGTHNIAGRDFIRDFDLMGLQRHLKVIGIFARLSLRDGKSGYLADIPVAIRYVLQVLPDIESLHDFEQWFRSRVLPAARQQLPRPV